MLKAEEMRILEQIEALIAQAGPDSYIAMSFEDVPEMCRQNIENDTGNSMREYRIAWDLEREKLLRENYALRDSMEQIGKNYKAELAEREQKIADLNHDYNIEEKHNAELVEALKDMTAQYMKAQDTIAEWQERGGNMRLEIMELKAKLYDYMTK